MIRGDKILKGKWILSGGKIYDPFKEKYLKGDILIINGKFDKIVDSEFPKKDINILDCTNKVITHPFVDLHAHFREPGREDKETLESGCLSALYGGYTTVCLMPNTDPPIDTPELIKFIIDKTNEYPIQILPIGAITNAQSGKELTEIGLMVKEGAVAISDDGIPVEDSRIMRYALEYSKMFGIPVINHAEDVFLRSGAVMNESSVSTKLGLQGSPHITESIMVSRDLMINEHVNSRIHVPHVSSKESVEIIRRYKKSSNMVSAEVTPHHLYFNDESLSTFNSNLKVAPPIRSEEHRKALIEGLNDGTIDCIATDHAPHNIEEKESDFLHASCGMIGLETAFSSSFTALSKEKISIEKIISLFTSGPCKVMNINKEFLEEGSSAEIVVLDFDRDWEVSKNDFKSKSSNSGFIGETLKSRVTHTISGKDCFIND